ncbi:DUF2829 domain-containing protein [Chromobacterium sp. ASV23]|uniref:DUF2829 domain-containing protein n=1 Tax=Chromobacterium sp. ASV23 TaxID=2795110 RepID=UPI0018EDF7BC|nr:DUF2829 domain-containing protein [Chromobacterium sp. ASV23]
MTTQFNFGKALDLLKSGLRVTRAGWNGKGLSVALQAPDAHSKMTRPYFYLITPAASTRQFGVAGETQQCVPWLPSQTDLLADDWELVE